MDSATPTASGPTVGHNPNLESAPSARQKPILPVKSRARGKRKESGSDEGTKRRCVSTACIGKRIY
jgi:hypothetical protein